MSASSGDLTLLLRHLKIHICENLLAGTRSHCFLVADVWGAPHYSSSAPCSSAYRWSLQKIRPAQEAVNSSPIALGLSLKSFLKGLERLNGNEHVVLVSLFVGVLRSSMLALAEVAESSTSGHVYDVRGRVHDYIHHHQLQRGGAQN